MARSFAQMALLVARAECCAVLPSFASCQLDSGKVANYQVDGLTDLERKVSFAWNPQRAEIKPLIEKAVAVAAR